MAAVIGSLVDHDNDKSKTYGFYKAMCAQEVVRTRDKQAYRVSDSRGADVEGKGYAVAGEKSELWQH